MRVLITGINGFIGRALSAKLSELPDTEVFGLSRSGTPVPGVECFPADILSADEVNRLFSEQQFDVVCHLAALTAHSDIVDNKYGTLDINLTGTRNILTAFNRYCKNALFVYTSTGKVYGKTNEMPITENAVTNPTNILGKSKLITERLVDFYAEPGNSYLILRIFNIYGAKQRQDFIVPTIISQIKQSGCLTLGSLDDKRDYLYIDDLIAALSACIVRKEAFRSQVTYLNIGSGEPASVSDIIDEFENILGRPLHVMTDKSRMRNDETPVEYCDNSLITSLTGWKPEYDLHAGIYACCRDAGLI